MLMKISIFNKSRLNDSLQRKMQGLKVCVWEKYRLKKLIYVKMMILQVWEKA